MDFIIELFSEIILEFVFEFIFEGVFSKRIPLILRILFAVILLAFFGALTIGLIVIGIVVDNIFVLLIGIFMTIMSAWALVRKLKERNI